MFPDGSHLYLCWGWKHFACALDLQDGFSLVLRYDSQSQINVKVFELTTCCKQYPPDFKASGSQLSLPIMEPRIFVVILKKYHLKAKYLVSTRARHRTYRCCKLPVSSFSSIFFVQGKEHASGLQGSAWLPVAGRHQAADG